MNLNLLIFNFLFVLLVLAHLNASSKHIRVNELIVFVYRWCVLSDSFQYMYVLCQNITVLCIIYNRVKSRRRRVISVQTQQLARRSVDCSRVPHLATSSLSSRHLTEQSANAVKEDFQATTPSHPIAYVSYMYYSYI